MNPRNKYVVYFRNGGIHRFSGGLEYAAQTAREAAERRVADIGASAGLAADAQVAVLGPLTHYTDTTDASIQIYDIERTPVVSPYRVKDQA